MIDSALDPHVRDHGVWHPEKPPTRTPLFARPFFPVKALKWLTKLYLGSWFVIFYLLLAAITWRYLTPDLATLRKVEPGWIAAIFARNFLLIVIFAGVLHLRLYVRKAQGLRFKFKGSWPTPGSRAFLFRNQTLDNIFWTLCSAVPIWTAYEVLSLWAMANGFIPYVDFFEHPGYCVLLVMAMPWIHDLHFYLIHRLIHWKPIYRAVHYIHHKNVNPGPWSGLAMHPLEHLVFFSGVLVYWVVPSSSLHIVYYLQMLALGAAQGHSGFQKIVVGKNEIDHGDYFHYLHHKFFECNYGGGLMPIDEWRGTFHDGSKESEAKMRQRVKSSLKKEVP